MQFQDLNRIFYLWYLKIKVLELLKLLIFGKKLALRFLFLLKIAKLLSPKDCIAHVILA
jgi:hypothetical protein